MEKKTQNKKVEKMSQYQIGFTSGFEMGKAEGRKQLQQELLDLLGVYDKFETIKDDDD